MSPRTTERPLPPRGRLRYSGVWRLYWVRLRRRWPQELLALLGIAVGVALLFASQVARTSLSGPVNALAEGIVGNSQLQLLARSPDGFSEAFSDTVARLPGVRGTAPMLHVQVNLVGPRGSRGVTLYGADPRVIELRGTLLQGFNSVDETVQRMIALPTPTARKIGARFGDRLLIQVSGRSATLPAAVVGRDQIGRLTDTSIALTSLQQLQKLSGLRGRVTRVLVEAQPDQVPQVRRRLEQLSDGSFTVASASYEVSLFNNASSPTSQATTLFSVLSALVGFLFALCAMLVTVAGRRALADDLRRSGFRRSHVLQVLLLDALMLGAAASLAGLALGEMLSRQGFGSDVRFLGGAFPVGSERIVTWSSVAVAVCGGMLAAVLGVLAPLRQVFVPGRAAAPGAPAGSGDARYGTLLPVVGVVCLVIAIAITVAAPGAAVIALPLLALSLAFLLPLILDTAILALTWLSRRSRRGWIVVAELALQQLRSREWRVRSLAITMTGAIAVFGAIALQGSRSNLQAGLDRVSVELNSAADLWISPFASGDEFSTVPFDAGAVGSLRDLPAVRETAVARGSFLDIGDRRVQVTALPVSVRQPIPPSELDESDLAKATARLRAGGWAAVSRGVADDLDLHVGGRFTLPSPRPTSFRVAAITTNLGWPGGAVMVNADDYADAWQTDATSAYLVRLSPGVSPAEGRRLVTAALGPRSALRVETAAERSVRQQAAARSGLARLSQIATLTLIAAVLAMAAAIAGLLWQHRRVVSRHKLDGHRTRRMWGALFVEAGTLIMTGCLAGALFALPGQILCTRGIEVVMGFPVNQGLRLEIVGWSLLLVVTASLLVVAVPGYLVARVRPSLRD